MGKPIEHSRNAALAGIPIVDEPMSFRDWIALPEYATGT
jgi:hypothetical protein